MIYELFPNYVPRPPLPRKVGGHDPPAPMGAPPLNVRHRLGLATRTQISVCKSPFPAAGTAVSLDRQQLLDVNVFLTVDAKLVTPCKHNKQSRRHNNVNLS